MQILSYFNPFDKLQSQARKDFKNLDNKHKALTVVATALGALAGLPLLGVGGAMTGAATFRRMVEINQKPNQGLKDKLPVYYAGLNAINASRQTATSPSTHPSSVGASGNATQVAGNKQPLATPTGLVDYNENNATVQTYFKKLLLQGAAAIAKAPKGVSLGLDTYNFLAYALFHASENKPKDMEVRFHLPSGHRYRIPNPNTRQILYGQVVEINGIMTAASEFQEINRERKRLGQPIVEKMFIPSVAKENGKVDHGLLTVIEADPHDDYHVKVSIINPMGLESYKDSQILMAQGIKYIFPKATFVFNEKRQQTDGKYCGVFQLMNIAGLSDVADVQNFVRTQQLAPASEKEIDDWFSTEVKPKLAEVASNILKS